MSLFFLFWLCVSELASCAVVLVLFIEENEEEGKEREIGQLLMVVLDQWNLGGNGSGFGTVWRRGVVQVVQRVASVGHQERERERILLHLCFF